MVKFPNTPSTGIAMFSSKRSLVTAYAAVAVIGHWLIILNGKIQFYMLATTLRLTWLGRERERELNELKLQL